MASAITSESSMHSGTGDGRSECTLAVEDRLAAGRSPRRQISRSAHERWTAPESRPDSIALFRTEDQGRLPKLIPVRYERMLASRFNFYRAASVLMASLLSSTPVTGSTVQAFGYAAMISGHMGDGDAFDTAIVGFARAYADQTERDHAALVAAVSSGKFTAAMGR